MRKLKIYHDTSVLSEISDKIVGVKYNINKRM